MGRLIDADAFKNFIESLPKEPNGTSRAYDEASILHFIDTQPTAYDVEKVVAELGHEAKLQKLFEEEFYARHNIAQAHIQRYAEQCYRNKAIDIVRKGGAT